MSHYIDITIEGDGIVTPTLRCTEPSDAPCRKRQLDVNAWDNGGHECWAVEWIDAVGFEEAVRLSGDYYTFSIPVHVMYDEGPELDILPSKLSRVMDAVSNHPDPCEKHPDDDIVSCGWKSAYRDVVRILHE